MYGYIDGFAGILSTTTLALMAIERYSMIKNPLKSMKNKSIMSKIHNFNSNFYLKITVF